MGEDEKGLGEEEKAEEKEEERKYLKRGEGVI